MIKLFRSGGGLLKFQRAVNLHKMFVRAGREEFL